MAPAVAIRRCCGHATEDRAYGLMAIHSVYRHFLCESAQKRLPISLGQATDDGHIIAIAYSGEIGALAAPRYAERAARVANEPLS